MAEFSQYSNALLILCSVPEATANSESADETAVLDTVSGADEPAGGGKKPWKVSRQNVDVREYRRSGYNGL